MTVQPGVVLTESGRIAQGQLFANRSRLSMKEYQRLAKSNIFNRTGMGARQSALMKIDTGEDSEKPYYTAGVNEL
jgi:hypothetical protein